MIVIAGVYHEHRYLTSVAHAQFAYLVDKLNVKPASVKLKIDFRRSSANAKKRNKKTNFQQMEIMVQTLEKEHILVIFNLF
jgi:hypothetical protein